MPAHVLRRKTGVVSRSDSNPSRLPSALKHQTEPPVNAQDVIRTSPAARRFEIGDLLFCQFSCPPHDEPLRIWSHTDHLVHVVTARATWGTPMGTCSVEAGETVYFRKGAFVLPPHGEFGSASHPKTRCSESHRVRPFGPRHPCARAPASPKIQTGEPARNRPFPADERPALGVEEGLKREQTCLPRR